MMSQENVEIIRAIYMAYANGDYPSTFEFISENVEFHEPPDISGGNVARGHEGMARSLARWLRAWTDYHNELRELIDAGDRVFVRGWQSGRGKGSGIEISEEIFSVWTVRPGKAVEQRMFRDRAQALEAAGLSGQDAHADS